MSDHLHPMTAGVFVGGTGRSGTTIAAELIAQSSRYAMVPIEIRFHADPGGLADLLDGRCSVEEFGEQMRTKWYHRKPNNNGMRGLHVISTGQDFEQALTRFESAATVDPPSAAAQLVHDLLDPVARRAGKPGWIEMTPPSIRAAGPLGLAMPDLRFVHMVRDGRDVGASIVYRSWGPKVLEEGIDYWVDELIALLRSQERVPAGQVLTLRIESLVGPDREDAYRRLLDFLDLDDEAPVRAFFEQRLTRADARIGRWRSGLDAERTAAVEAVYERALAKLEAAGFTLPLV